MLCWSCATYFLLVYWISRRYKRLFPILSDKRIYSLGRIYYLSPEVVQTEKLTLRSRELKNPAGIALSLPVQFKSTNIFHVKLLPMGGLNYTNPFSRTVTFTESVFIHMQRSVLIGSQKVNCALERLTYICSAGLCSSAVLDRIWRIWS